MSKYKLIDPDAPPTAKQLRYLAELQGFEGGETPKTKQEASDLIDACLESLEAGGGPDDDVMYGD